MAEIAVLIVGSGGREHELARQLAEVKKISRIYVAPGNAGTARLKKTDNIDLAITDVPGIVAFVQQQHIGYVIIGPEAPLVIGLADAVRAKGVAVFGPSQQAARLEASKAYAAEFMQRQHIPQPQCWIARSLPEALSIIADKTPDSYVLKADGLAGGKGVVLPRSTEEAQQTLRLMFSGQGFDGAGREAVVIQERLHGPEVSAFAMSDGEHCVLLPFAQDHKRLQDNDQGPNTGGMGAYSPLPATIVDSRQAAKIRDIATRTIAGMASEGTPYQGVLFMGLMLAQEHGDDPLVIEYNVRFGDPETQVLLPLLQESGVDVGQLLLQTARGDISSVSIPASFHKAALTVCLAAAGYPSGPRKGDVIEGPDNSYANVIVHHGATQQDGEKVVTAGGRVLYVTGFGDTPAQAAEHAYQAIGPNGIHFAGMQYRSDIGHQVR